MCGINGFNFKNEALIQKMNQATKHRGPDGSGFFVDEYISLGHNLLAIADTPEVGKQPFYSEDKKHVLVYNGEIYNYKVLKNDLVVRGHSFSTSGDTEVLLKGLVEEGVDFLKKLNGMFAFAFYDKEGGRLILARDPSGMKPFYYWQYNGKIIFSSEFRGIFSHPEVARKVNPEALNVFFNLGYLPGPLTLIDNIKKLSPGECLLLDLKSGKEKKIWLDIPSTSLPVRHFDDGIFGDMVGNAVFDHTMGLRPFGMYLSGGLDSSIVLYELIKKGVQRPATYTTRFEVDDPKYNEDADLADIWSKKVGANHHEFFVSEKDFIEAIPQVVEAIEEPRYHPSIPAYYLMAKEASKESVVILTGDGGDELFLGYPHYGESLKISRRYGRYPAWFLNWYYTFKNVYKKQIPVGMKLALDRVLYRWCYFSRILSNKNSRLFNFDVSPKCTLDYLSSIRIPSAIDDGRDIENSVAGLDRLFWMAEDSLIITDKVGMHFGMEGRFPLLDRRVVEYASAISSKEKLALGQKSLLRKHYRGKLPDEIINKKKTGWTAPVHVWMSSKLGDMAREVLSPDFYSGTRNLFNFSRIHSDFLKSGGDNFSKISVKTFYPIFMFQIWASLFKIRF